MGDTAITKIEQIASINHCILLQETDDVGRIVAIIVYMGGNSVVHVRAQCRGWIYTWEVHKTCKIPLQGFFIDNTSFGIGL